jgi:hypothetical protein
VTIDVRPAPADAVNRFRISVKADGAVVEEFDDLTMANVEQEVNEGSAFIEVNDLGSATVAPGNRPADVTDRAVPLGLDDGDFIGDAAAKNGLHAFDAVDDINIVAIPDRPGDREVTLQAYTYCQNRADCFFWRTRCSASRPSRRWRSRKAQGLSRATRSTAPSRRSITRGSSPAIR